MKCQEILGKAIVSVAAEYNIDHSLQEACDWGRLIGSVLFSLGILAIVMFEMKLFTGLISDIPEMGAKNW